MKRDFRSDGFSLIEVALALGVAAFCLIAIFGLLPVAMQSNRTAVEQTAATGIISSVIADLRATPPTVPVGGAATSELYDIDIPAAGGAGSDQQKYFDDDRKLVPSENDARYRLTVRFVKILGGEARSASCAILKVSWPAAVDPEATSGRRPEGVVTSFVALDRN